MLNLFQEKVFFFFAREENFEGGGGILNRNFLLEINFEYKIFFSGDNF